MTHIEIEKSTTTCICITDIEIALDNETNYELSENDSFFFTVRKVTGNCDVVMSKCSPDTIELQNNNLLIQIAPEETANLPSVAYSFDCKIDIEKKGTHIYTIASGIIVITGGSTNGN